MPRSEAGMKGRTDRTSCLRKDYRGMSSTVHPRRESGVNTVFIRPVWKGYEKKLLVCAHLLFHTSVTNPCRDHYSPTCLCLLKGFLIGTKSYLQSRFQSCLMQLRSLCVTLSSVESCRLVKCISPIGDVFQSGLTLRLQCTALVCKVWHLNHHLGGRL